MVTEDRAYNLVAHEAEWTVDYKFVPWIIAASIAIFIAYVVQNDEVPARFAPVNRIDEPILFRFVIGLYVILFFLFCYIGVRLL